MQVYDFPLASFAHPGGGVTSVLSGGSIESIPYDFDTCFMASCTLFFSLEQILPGGSCAPGIQAPYGLSAL